MTYGEKYEQIITDLRFVVDEELNKKSGATLDGDLWQEDARLEQVRKLAEEGQALLREVSKVAFERVMKERH